MLAVGWVMVWQCFWFVFVQRLLPTNFGPGVGTNFPEVVALRMLGCIFGAVRRRCCRRATQDERRRVNKVLVRWTSLVWRCILLLKHKNRFSTSGLILRRLKAGHNRCEEDG